jgi:hypothetical protein
VAVRAARYFVHAQRAERLPSADADLTVVVALAAVLERLARAAHALRRALLEVIDAVLVDDHGRRRLLWPAVWRRRRHHLAQVGAAEALDAAAAFDAQPGAREVLAELRADVELDAGAALLAIEHRTRHQQLALLPAEADAEPGARIERVAARARGLAVRRQSRIRSVAAAAVLTARGSDQRQ